MRVRQILIDGDAPGRSVELTRDGENVTACIYGPRGKRKGALLASHIVPADQRDRLYEMARTVQQTVDGYAGTNGDIDGYWRMVQMLSD